MIIRGALFIYVLSQPEVFLQPDSKMYVSLATGLVENGSLSYPENHDRLSAERAPGYPFYLALCMWITGGSMPAVVFIQMIIGSLSCVLIYYLGETLWHGSGFLSGILASVNLGMISYSLFVLNDSLFLFVFSLALMSMVNVLRRPNWRLGFLLGVCMGTATMIRPVIIYLPLVLIPFLFGVLLIKHREGVIAAIGKAFMIGIVFVICLSPWMMRNYIHYGRWSLTAQSGEHLLQYIIPFTWQYSKGIPFIEGMKKTSDAFKEKASKEKLDLEKASPFEVSDFQVRMALDYLREEPKAAIAKAWFFGMGKNLFAPSIIDFSSLLNIERPHFFSTEGTTTPERAWNFVKGIEGWFGWAVIGGLVLLCLSRIVQVWGLIQMMWGKRWEGLFLLWIIGYFLLISGPVGYAKYRLPFEPILTILLSIGIKDLFSRLFRLSRIEIETQ